MSPRSLAFAAPVGRVLLSLIFVLSALGKLADWQGPAKMMAEKGLPSVDALLAVAVALELIGGLAVMIGFQARWGAVALLAFLIPVTVIMHNFWAFEEPQRTEQMINFMKNVAIAGGVTLVLAF